MVYVPPIATFLGDSVVLPGQIWRLAWPIQLAAMLTLGWVLWTATGYVVGWLEGLGPARFLGRVLPVLLVVVLAVAAVPQARAGMESIAAHREKSRESGSYPSDPIFPGFAMRFTRRVVVLASDIRAPASPLLSSEANVVSPQGQPGPQVLPELKKRVLAGSTCPRAPSTCATSFGRRMATSCGDTCAPNRVDNVMFEKGSPLADWLKRGRAFEPVETAQREVRPVHRGSLRAARIEVHPWHGPFGRMLSITFALGGRSIDVFRTAWRQVWSAPLRYSRPISRTSRRRSVGP